MPAASGMRWQDAGQKLSFKVVDCKLYNRVRTMTPSVDNAAPKLFISYSHDSEKHEDLILRLANRLRKDGVDAIIDQFDTALSDEWPRWMDRQIQEADFVAIVCTETYLRRVEAKASREEGRGVLWEVKIIYNHLYSENEVSKKFVPVLIEGGSQSFIPWPLRGLTHYRVDTDQGYEKFYRHITRQPLHEMAPLGKLKKLHTLVPRDYPASLHGDFGQKPWVARGTRNRRNAANNRGGKIESFQKWKAREKYLEAAAGLPKIEHCQLSTLDLDMLAEWSGCSEEKRPFLLTKWINEDRVRPLNGRSFFDYELPWMRALNAGRTLLREGKTKEALSKIRLAIELDGHCVDMFLLGLWGKLEGDDPEYLKMAEAIDDEVLSFIDEVAGPRGAAGRGDKASTHIEKLRVDYLNRMRAR